uniref:hypothetical protein n=1 Tax=Microbacterium aurum TaxID=36805 RepID=UPI0028E7CDC2
MNRTLNVVRLQLVNKQTYIWVPLLVLGGSFAISFAIYAILASSGVTDTVYGMGAQAPLWYFMVVGVQALTLTFPFSQALSVTRREFWLGTLLTAAITSAILAGVFIVGGLIEQATNGWGINGWFFVIPGISDGGVLVTGLFYFSVAMLIFVIGFWSATIYKRFGSLWLTVVLVGIGLLLVLMLWYIGSLQAWGQVFAWIGRQGTVGMSLWGLLLAAV